VMLTYIKFCFQISFQCVAKKSSVFFYVSFFFDLLKASTIKKSKRFFFSKQSELINCDRYVLLQVDTFNITSRISSKEIRATEFYLLNE